MSPSCRSLYLGPDDPPLPLAVQPPAWPFTVGDEGGLGVPREPDAEPRLPGPDELADVTDEESSLTQTAVAMLNVLFPYTRENGSPTSVQFTTAPELDFLFPNTSDTANPEGIS